MVLAVECLRCSDLGVLLGNSNIQFNQHLMEQILFLAVTKFPDVKGLTGHRRQ